LSDIFAIGSRHTDEIAVKPEQPAVSLMPACWVTAQVPALFEKSSRLQRQSRRNRHLFPVPSRLSGRLPGQRPVRRCRLLGRRVVAAKSELSAAQRSRDDLTAQWIAAAGIFGNDDRYRHPDRLISITSPEKIR
jgi:hypothetical protein